MPIFALIIRTSIKFNTEWESYRNISILCIIKSGLDQTLCCVEISKVCMGRD